MNTTQNPDACLSFGGFVRARRMELLKTARAVALEAGMLPSNYCKLELGAHLPPRDQERLRRLAAALEFVEGEENTFSFYDLAAAATNSIPVHISDLISREDVIPMMARSLGRRKLTREEIEKIMNIVRGQN